MPESSLSVFRDYQVASDDYLEYTPEKRLLLAVLETAVRELTSSDYRWRKLAYLWITAKYDDSLLSFNWVIDTLELEDYKKTILAKAREVAKCLDFIQEIRAKEANEKLLSCSVPMALTGLDVLPNIVGSLEKPLISSELYQITTSK